MCGTRAFAGCMRHAAFPGCMRGFLVAESLRLLLVVEGRHPTVAAALVPGAAGSGERLQLWHRAQ